MLSIGQLAKQTGITVETIRFYEKKGLIDSPQRTESGYRQSVKRVSLNSAVLPGITMEYMAKVKVI